MHGTNLPTHFHFRPVYASLTDDLIKFHPNPQKSRAQLNNSPQSSKQQSDDDFDSPNPAPRCIRLIDLY